jgi:hypothetical protein
MAPHQRDHLFQDNEEIPSHFFCPITHEVMREPLMSKNGIRYESSAIMDWLASHNNTCPMTRQPLNVSVLMRNRRLQGEIQCWFKARALELDQTEEPTGEKPRVLMTFLASKKTKKRASKKTKQNRFLRLIGCGRL